MLAANALVHCGINACGIGGTVKKKIQSDGSDAADDVADQVEDEDANDDAAFELNFEDEEEYGNDEEVPADLWDAAAPKSARPNNPFH